MKPLILAVLALGAAASKAQDAYRDMSTDKALEIYAGIIAGRVINERCKLLSAEAAAELDKNRLAVMQELMRTWNPGVFPMVEDTSRQLAAEKPYKSCKREAKDAVLDAVRFADEWAAEIAATVKTRH